MQAALSIYFATFFWGLKASELAIFPIFQALAACCAVPIAHMLGKRFDKKRAAIGSFLFMISFGPLMLFGRLVDIVPENDSSLLLPMLLAHNFVEVCVIIVFSILFGAMMADVVEDSAVDTTRRSEGVIFAARGFAGKWFPASAFFGGVILSAPICRATRHRKMSTDRCWSILCFMPRPADFAVFVGSVDDYALPDIAQKTHENITQLSIS